MAQWQRGCAAFLASILALAGACAQSAQPAPARSSAAGKVAPEITKTPPAPAAVIASGYDKPPQAVLDVMRATPPPSFRLSPTGESAILATQLEYPSIERVAEPYLKLAGVRVEPRNHGRHDTPAGYGIRSCTAEIRVLSVATATEKAVALPQGSCPSMPFWSPDGARFAFENAAAEAIELWVGDASAGTAHVVPGVRLNPMFDHEVQWLADSKSLFVKLVPDDLGAAPGAQQATISPSTQETNGEKGESSTYETRDTLQNAQDEALFEYYGASQLAVIDSTTGAIKRVGERGLYDDVDVAPDDVHVRIEAIKRPYSYITTYDRFARDVVVQDLSNSAVHLVASIPLADRVPVHGVRVGPRAFEWRATEPATLVWGEALDGGDWKVEVPARDKVMMHKAPFTGAPVEVTRTQQRFTGVAWSEAPGIAFLYEDDENRHWRRVFTLDVDNSQIKPAVLFDLSTDEKYKNPGGFVYRRMPSGTSAVRLDADTVYLSGLGSSPTGDRPFLDRLDLKTKKSERLFRSEKSVFESFIGFASQKPNEPSFLSWHQTPIDAPNAFVRTLGAAVANAAEGESAFETTTKPVTHMADPTPQVRAIKKRLVQYKRKDGMDLSFTLYTPPGYVEGTRVPTILYAYPQDFADAKKAGQITGSEYTFTRLRQYRLLLLAGYAVIDQAAFPIVGDPKKAYDTYLEQLVADAKAAVDKAVELGVADPDRVGVTGHSHGALMTVNLLAHSELFRAGVATSGSYNKTLTPFGFQNERRSVWEAQNVYLKASPFFSADQLKRPLLLVHGADDANPGTTPLQATKLYEAIRGNGGTARLVMLPHEPHWYAALESNEQLIAEMIKWFDKHVKNAGPRATPPSAASAKSVEH